MSNPISTLPNADLDRTNDDEPALEIDATDASEDGAEPTLEVDDDFAADDGAAGSEDATESKDSGGRSGLILLVLAGLLLGSVAINLKQSRDVSTLEARSSEYEQALAAAVERIDNETARADGAEAALDRVDGAVDVVNARVLDLQEALDGLREATVR